MLVAGLAMLFLLGAWHMAGIHLIRRVRPVSDSRPYLAVMVAFWGLVLLHFSEIVLGAGAYALALSFPDTGSISHVGGSRAAGLLYFSGINFATLGFTGQDARGPVRLLVMLQALGGFMLITWSATLVYSIWGDEFRKGND
ncbi:conserved hypothetical protein [Altererythrobacter sp. B11]|nr:conserved hypothetical protein [Altererythrobacter sp. B11]